MSYEEIFKYVNEVYNIYMAYFGFSKMHLIIFVTLVITVIGLIHIGMKKYYDKQDLMTWIREK